MNDGILSATSPVFAHKPGVGRHCGEEAPIIYFSLSCILSIIEIVKNILHVDIPANRNFGLDIVRFLAIAVVLIEHSTVVLPKHYYNFFHSFVFDGVNVFFVLSGFLIGRIFIRDFSEGFSFKKMFHFWKRRWYRTLPAYYFTIILIVLISFIVARPIHLSALSKCMIFIQNLFVMEDGFFGESWSLAVEEWFYLLLPVFSFLLYHLFKVSIKTNILITGLLVIVYSVLLRFSIWNTGIVTEITAWAKYLRNPVYTRLDSMFTGVLTAWIFSFKKDFFQSKKLPLFIAGLSVFAFNKITIIDLKIIERGSQYASVWYFLTNSIAIGMMLPFFYYVKSSPKSFLFRFITVGSIISYSMYLLNLTIISDLFLNQLNINHWFKFLLFWMLTLGCSILMYKYIERPFIRLRER